MTGRVSGELSPRSRKSDSGYLFREASRGKTMERFQRIVLRSGRALFGRRRAIECAARVPHRRVGGVGAALLASSFTGSNHNKAIIDCRTSANGQMTRGHQIGDKISLGKVVEARNERGSAFSSSSRTAVSFSSVVV